jgi:pimeloyl-ACP methyl ester carboxylesterase
MTTLWTDLLGEPFTTAYYDVEGVRTRTLEAGRGPAVLLLHGRGGHLENWSRNIVPLSRHFHVIALDMLGHGYTAKPSIDYTIGNYAAHVLAFLRARGMDRVSMVGQSLGGWVAAWLAQEQPQRIEKLVLVNTNGFCLIPAEVVGKIRQSSRAAVESPTPDSVRRRFQPLFLDPNLITEELVRIRLDIYRQAEMKNAMERIVGSELEPENQGKFELTAERLRKIAVPTLILWSSHDPLLPWQEAHRYQQTLPDSRFHLLENCAHWPQYENPQEFNRIVGEFLLESESAADNPADRNVPMMEA